MCILFPFKLGSIIVYKGQLYKPGKWIVSIWYPHGKNIEFTFGG